MLDQRIILVLGSSLVLVAAAAGVRPESLDRGIPEPLFWELKVNASAEHDVVFCGDSRTYRGISPAAVGDVLPGLRVLNFGFASTGLTPDYLQACSGKLSPEAEDPVLVIGVTPYSLTDNALRSNAFIDAQADLGVERFEWEIDLEEFLWNFRPLSEVEMHAWGNEGARVYSQDFHAGGWVESNLVPANESAALEPYRRNFANNSMRSGTLTAVLEQVAAFTRAGIRVFGFRPPISAELRALEDLESDFREQLFVEGFESAGGRWVEVVGGEFQTYDGSHLVPESAERLSRELARGLGGR
jgi:hypothetical protein